MNSPLASMIRCILFGILSTTFLSICVQLIKSWNKNNGNFATASLNGTQYRAMSFPGPVIRKKASGIKELSLTAGKFC